MIICKVRQQKKPRDVVKKELVSLCNRNERRGSQFSQKICRTFCIFRKEMLNSAAEFSGFFKLFSPLIASSVIARANLSYTGLWQALNSLCEQEKQVLSITKPVSIV